MTGLARKPATYADVLAAPRERVAELLEGELLLSPRPGGPHAAAASALLEELGPPFKRARGGPGGWILLFEPELHLGQNVLVPDLAGWRRERLPEIPQEPPYFELAPDWVCEVLSPTTSQLDRTKKLPLYARAGVSSVWLIDPSARILEVLTLEGERYVIDGAYADAAQVRAVPFDALDLDLSLLWADVQRA